MEYQTSKGQIGFGPGGIPDILGLDIGLSDSTFWVNSGMSKTLSEFQLWDNSTLETFIFPPIPDEARIKDVITHYC